MASASVRSSRWRLPSDNQRRNYDRCLSPDGRSIVGEPTLQELIRIQDTHMIPYAQSNATTINALNYIHLCVLANIYTQYTNKAYPEILPDPGP